MFCLAKKYHPIIVEKAKNNKQSATNLGPMFANPSANAACATAVPVNAFLTPSTICSLLLPYLPSSTPVESITRAVIVSTTKVSINTPIMATSP